MTKLPKLALSLVALCPAIVILSVIARYGVDIPYSDEWTFASLFLKARDHTLAFSDLFAQHNEHRIFFPRLLLIGFYFLAPGSLRAEMAFSVLLCGLTSFNLWLILKRTLRHSTEKRLLLLILINLVLFSPVQAENWTWGFQFVLFLINLLVTTGITVATSELRIQSKFWLCTIVAIIGSFSFGNGFILWLTTFPIALIRQNNRVFNWKSPWLLAWAAAFVGTAVIFFTGYTKPANHPPLAASSAPLDYPLYVFTFLGAHLSQASHVEPITLAALIGTFLLIVFTANLGFCVSRANSPLSSQMAPWLAIGLFAIGSAILAALTRVGFGVNQALESRYTTFSVLLSIAVIGLVSIAHDALSHARRQSDSHRILFARLETAGVTLFLLAAITSAKWGIDSIKSIERTRLRGKASLLLANVLDTGKIYENNLVGWAPDVLRYANLENSLGLLQPQLFQTTDISQLPTIAATKTVLGYLDKPTCSDDQLTITGWAVLPKRRRVADCVAVAYEGPDGRRVIFALSDQAGDRPDVAAALHRNSLLRCGWAVRFPRSAVPSGEQRISAWAIDSRQGVLIELNNTQILP